MTKRILVLLGALCASSALAIGPIRAPLNPNNATVPGSATILPVQAWVDNIAAVYVLSQDLDLSNKGITHFAPSLLYTSGNDNDGRLLLANASGFLGINLSGNALSSAEVNAFLARCVLYFTNVGSATFTINLSGAGMAAPTGQGLTDKQTLNDNAWIVTTN